VSTALPVGTAQPHRRPAPVAGATSPGRLLFLIVGLHLDHADGAAADELLVLGAGGRVERAPVVVEARGRAAEQHGDLAFDIDPGEIVLLELRRVHALPHEHDRCLDARIALVEIHARQELLAESQRLLRTVAKDHQLAAVIHAHAAQHRHALVIAAIVAGRRQAHRAVALRDIQRGQVVASRAGFAAFEQVVGEEADIGLDAPRVRARAGVVGFARRGRCRRGGALAGGEQMSRMEAHGRRIRQGSGRAQCGDASTAVRAGAKCRSGFAGWSTGFGPLPHSHRACCGAEGALEGRYAETTSAKGLP
jgi:hypothetical protein